LKLGGTASKPSGSKNTQSVTATHPIESDRSEVYHALYDVTKTGVAAHAAPVLSPSEEKTVLTDKECCDRVP
jgi:hypothetical protein